MTDPNNPQALRAQRAAERGSTIHRPAPDTLQRALDQMQGRCDRLTADLDAAVSKGEELADANDKLKAALDALGESDLGERCATLQSQVDELTSERDALQGQVTAQQEIIEQQQKQIAELQAKIDRA